MKILVAGGAGYVGSALIPVLIERGYKVDVVDLFWFGDHLPDAVRRIKSDIFDVPKDHLKDYDTVIFLAGLSNDPMAEFSPGKNFIFNAAAPAYLGYIAKEAGVPRVIYASSCSVYGYTKDELYDETSPAVSNYPYGISKLQGEQALMQLVDDQFSVISLRQGTISGYSPRMRLDLIVNTMFKAAVSGKKITVNNPAIWRPILSIKDAVQAYVRSIESSMDISGIFNVASSNYTVGEVADLVKEGVEDFLGEKIALDIKAVQDYRNYKVSVEKAQKILSFKPRHTVDSIVRHLIKHYEKFKDFDNPDFYNIAVFKSLEEQG
jgi:nucleoside-diphosphate-sugar epimerase